MSKSTRELAKRELDRARGNIEWVGKHLNSVIETYQKQHPEVSEPLVVGLNMLMELDNLIEQVRSSF